MCFAVTLKFPEGRQYRLRDRGKRARSNNSTRLLVVGWVGMKRSKFDFGYVLRVELTTRFVTSEMSEEES